MKTHLTVRLLDAIVEALVARDAGEIEHEGEADGPSRIDYRDALDWALSEVDRRRIKREAKADSQQICGQQPANSRSARGRRHDR